MLIVASSCVFAALRQQPLPQRLFALHLRWLVNSHLSACPGDAYNGGQSASFPGTALCRRDSGRGAPESHRRPIPSCKSTTAASCPGWNGSIASDERTLGRQPVLWYMHQSITLIFTPIVIGAAERSSFRQAGVFASSAHWRTLDQYVIPSSACFTQISSASCRSQSVKTHVEIDARCAEPGDHNYDLHLGTFARSTIRWPVWDLGH